MSPFRVHTLCTASIPVLASNGHDQNSSSDISYQRSRLCFVSCLPQATPDPTHTQTRTSILTHALLLHETVSNQGATLTVYVEKADSSGFASKSESASVSPLIRVLHSYLNTQQKIFNKVAVHVFARAQPQYLFPNSASNPKKHVLSDIRLVQWWARSLTLALPSGQPNRILRKFLFVPSKDASYLKTIVGPDHARNWSYGFGFGCLDPRQADFSVEKLQNLKACDVVPQFPDDTKTKALRMLERNATVSDLKEVLSVTSECSSSVAGFFGVFLQKAAGVGSSLMSSTSNEEQEKEVEEAVPTTARDAEAATELETRSEWDALMAFLLAQDFSDADKAAASSHALLNRFRGMQHLMYMNEVLGDEPVPRDEPVSTGSCEDGNIGAARLLEPSSSTLSAGTAVNNLQGMVKKRKIDTVAPASGIVSVPAVTLVNNLVKRKKL
ncbi:histone acetylation protein-domain-containing protein [Chytriomyces sp. MP71]|nr:histone acetylation protein-domain-containing protein [Chytriomyces sp. MP71]